MTDRQTLAVSFWLLFAVDGLLWWFARSSYDGSDGNDAAGHGMARAFTMIFADAAGLVIVLAAILFTLIRFAWVRYVAAAMLVAAMLFLITMFGRG